MTERERRWSPFEDLFDIQRDIGRFFRRAIGFGTEATRTLMEPGVWVPSVDLYAKDGNLVVKTELPGVVPSDINVSIQDGSLSISGERKTEKEMTEENVYRAESSYGKFKRAVSIPKEVKPGDIKATYSNGILTVEVPGAAKEKPAKAETIPVEVKSEK